MKSKPEARFEQQIGFVLTASADPMPIYEREHKFHPTRKWRFDFAWPDVKVAVEVEGVVWSGHGRHQTGIGLTGDCEKYAEALMLGWKVLRVTPQQIEEGKAIKWLRRLLKPEQGDEHERREDLERGESDAGAPHQV